jgi:hypothetical protein
MGLGGVMITFVVSAGVWAGLRQMGWPAALAAMLGLMTGIVLVAALSFAAYR